jgi:hypothetical protein
MRVSLAWVAVSSVAGAGAIVAAACNTEFTTAGDDSDAFVAPDAARASSIDATIVLSADSGATDAGTASDVVSNAITDAPVEAAKRVFVSRETFPGASGFDDAGGAACQAIANDAGLSGSWAVWHSDGNNAVNAIDLVGPGPWVLLDGTLATTRAQLVLPPISHAIDIDQHATPLSGSVWTGTDSTGQASGAACSAWSSSAVNTPGTFGESTTIEAGWTDITTTTCDQLLHVYCFEN